MPWGPGGAVTSASIATNLGWLFVFGPTDSGKNLVNGTTYSATLSGASAYGSDSIGTYVGQTALGRLTITTSTGSSFSGDYTYFLTFSRDSSVSVPAWAGLFSWITNTGTRDAAIQRDSSSTTTRYYYPGSFKSSSVVDVSSITPATEYTFVVVFSGTTMKVFYTGGASPISFTGTTTVGGQHYQLTIGGWTATEWYPGRFRAFGRWSRPLSDSEAQSMANNPQQIVAASSTTIAAGIGNATAAGAGQADLVTSIAFSAGNSVAAGQQFSVSETLAAGIGNAVAGGPSGATVSENTSLVAGVGNAAAAGQPFTVKQLIQFSSGNAVAAGQIVQVISSGPVVVSCTAGTASAAGLQCLVSSAVQMSVANAVAAGQTASLSSTDRVNLFIGNAVAAGKRARGFIWSVQTTPSEVWTPVTIDL